MGGKLLTVSAGNQLIPTGLSQFATALPLVLSLVWSLSCVHQFRDLILFALWSNCARGTFSVLRGKFLSLFPSLSLLLSLIIPVLLSQYKCRLWAFLPVFKKSRFLSSTNSCTVIFYTSATFLFYSKLNVFKVFPLLHRFRPHYWCIQQGWQHLASS